MAEIHQCKCPNCQQLGEHPEGGLHRRINLFLSRLDEQQRRWYVALESQKAGHGGDGLLAQIAGMNVETIRRVRRELDRRWKAVRSMGCAWKVVVLPWLTKRIRI